MDGFSCWNLSTSASCLIDPETFASRGSDRRAAGTRVAPRARTQKCVEKSRSTVAPMTQPLPPRPPTELPPRLAGWVTPASGLLGATVGWVLMRGAYCFDRKLAADHTAPGFFSFSWDNGSFTMSTITGVVMTMALTFTCLSLVVIQSRKHRFDLPPPRRNIPAPCETRSALDVLRAGTETY